MAMYIQLKSVKQKKILQSRRTSGDSKNESPAMQCNTTDTTQSIQRNQYNQFILPTYMPPLALGCKIGQGEHVLRNCGAIYECELNGVPGVAKVARAGLLTACPEPDPPPHVVEMVGLRSRDPEHRRHTSGAARSRASSKQHAGPLDERTPLVLECHTASLALV